MKRTFQAGINGRVYNIEEDAYGLLQDYLNELRVAFRAEEGEEIVGDIECRISEHFDTITSTEGRMVITIDDINRVITIMGRPEELQEAAGEIGDSDEEGGKTPGSLPPPPPATASVAGCGGTGSPAPYHRKLFRDVRHKVFGGVLAGLGQYLGWDVTMLRILVVIATVALGGWGYFWPILLCYMVAWMIIPPANTPLRILEMKGEPVTVDTVGQTVIDTSVPPSVPLPSEGNEFTRTLNSAFGTIGRVVLILIGIVAAIGAFVMAVLAMVVIVGMICQSVAGNDAILSTFDIEAINAPFIGGWAMTLLFFAIMLPLMCLAWLGLASLFSSTPRMSTATAVTLIVIEAVLIVACSTLAMLS